MNIETVGIVVVVVLAIGLITQPSAQQEDQPMTFVAVPMPQQQRNWFLDVIQTVIKVLLGVFIALVVYGRVFPG